jgi:hypothetical protein
MCDVILRPLNIVKLIITLACICLLPAWSPLRYLITCKATFSHYYLPSTLNCYHFLLVQAPTSHLILFPVVFQFDLPCQSELFHLYKKHPTIYFTPPPLHPRNTSLSRCARSKPLQTLPSTKALPDLEHDSFLLGLIPQELLHAAVPTPRSTWPPI